MSEAVAPAAENSRASGLLIPGQGQPIEGGVQIASKNVSVESLKQQARGQTPDVRGEKLVVASKKDSNDSLEKKAEETKVLTASEKKKMMEELPEEVLTADSVEEFEEQIINVEINAGKSPEEAKKKYQDFLAGAGGAVIRFWQETSTHSDLRTFLGNFFDSQASGREGSFGSIPNKEIQGRELITKGAFLDKLKEGPKKFGVALKKAYEDASDNSLNKKFTLNEQVMQALQKLVDSGDPFALQPVISALVKVFDDNQENWEAFRVVFAEKLFENKTKPYLASDIEQFMKDDLVKDNGYARAFNLSISNSSPQVGSLSSTTPVAA